jgi:hypothetical protein
MKCKPNVPHVLQECPVAISYDTASADILWVFDPLNKSSPDPLKINEIAGEIVSKLISLFGLAPASAPAPPALVYANNNTLTQNVIGVDAAPSTPVLSAAASASATSG